MTEKTIAVVLTVHNRCQTTLRCLQSLKRADLPDGHRLRLYVTDDGSTDNTAQCIREQFPDACVIDGNGQLYWGGGMEIAINQAMADDTNDYILWLNDDMVLYEDSLRRTVQCWSSRPDPMTILVGSTTAISSTTCNRGGVRSKSWWRKLNFSLIQPATDRTVSCDTFCGTFVFMPRAAAIATGSVDSKFRHRLGDYDFGLRARRKGCTLRVMPGFIGVCDVEDKSPYIGWKQEPNLLKSWHMANSPKGFPANEWLLFCRRHGGILWPLYSMFPYAKHLCRSVLNKRGTNYQ